MGFCRRCGEIVVGARCSCGGTAVAPVVKWNEVQSTQAPQDKWSNTYVSREKSPSRPLSTSFSTPITLSSDLTGNCTGDVSPTKRFPKPASTTQTQTRNTTQLGSRVSTHIANTTSQLGRPPSPLKYSTTQPAPESGILPCPNSDTLSKVYGSVLQPKETLAAHSCADCASPFSPDATIYPDPNEKSGIRFLCRSCFTVGGGSKGTCPSCSRPVLTLKSEGGFIQAAGQYWHKRCFRCAGCFKDIGNNPMVDLLGKPSCIDCFDGCLKRDSKPSTPSKKWESPHNISSNLGGMKMGKKSREGSPAIEELEKRLGINSREGSPALEELSNRLSTFSRSSEPSSLENPTRTGSSGSNNYLSSSTPPRRDRNSPFVRRESNSNSPIVSQVSGSRDRRADNSTSPVRQTYTGNGGPNHLVRQTTGGNRSPKPKEEALEEMKRRFMGGVSISPSPVSPISTSPLTPQRSSRHSLSSRSRRSSSPNLSTLKSSGSDIPIAKHSPRMHSNRADAIRSLEGIEPQTPDLVSDFSDTTTQSSGPDSPPQSDVFNMDHGRGDFFSALSLESRYGGGISPSITPTKSASKSSEDINIFNATGGIPNSTKAPGSRRTGAGTRCAECGAALFTAHSGGKFVTVPHDDGPRVYHTECFKCVVCSGVFRESGTGQAVFVKGDDGPCHVECAPPEKVVIKSMPNTYSPTPKTPPRPAVIPTNSPSSFPSTQLPSSSRYDRPPLTTPPTNSSISFPRFGSRTSCPGCHKSVSSMEHGVVPGPQGTRWHSACLICGGKKEIEKGRFVWPRETKVKGEPGCGKRLDSAAKTDGEGGVWCRECLLLLPAGLRGSPHMSPIAPSHTGGGRIAPQFTGTTTIARQFTGLGRSGVGNADAMLLRQLTGGGMSPTRGLSLSRPSSPEKALSSGTLGRSISPIKGMRPRPKSIVGVRGTNWPLQSVDEWR